MGSCGRRNVVQCVTFVGVACSFRQICDLGLARCFDTVATYKLALSMRIKAGNAYQLSGAEFVIASIRVDGESSRESCQGACISFPWRWTCVAQVLCLTRAPIEEVGMACVACNDNEGKGDLLPS